MKEISGLDNFVLFTMGKVDFNNPLGIVLWARCLPGPGFILHIMLSEICTGMKPIILVDDLLPSALFNREVLEQNIINKAYIDYMNRYGCSVVLSSQLFSPSIYFYKVVETLQRITYREFLRCLPEKKCVSGKFIELKTSEILHIGAELMLFEEIKKMGVGTIIIPEFAQAIVALHRNISIENPLSIIVTPVFNQKNMEKNIFSMRRLMTKFSRSIE